MNRGSEEDVFLDIKQLIKKKIEKNPTSSFLNDIYDIYYMFKCMCFILHDKPVHSLAPFLYDIFKNRMEIIYRIYKDETSFKEFKTKFEEIFCEGFNFKTDRSNPKVTQDRCHKTLDQLHIHMKNVMKTYEIHYPEMIRLYSIPYTAFKMDLKEDSREELKEESEIYKNINKLLSVCRYGLPDATGSVFKLGKSSIYPNTLSLQDAAGITHTDGELVIKEDWKSGRSIYSLNTETIDIPSLKFLDVEIRCIKYKHDNVEVNLFVYHCANTFEITDTDYGIIEVSFKNEGKITLNEDFVNSIKVINGKHLIGIITDKVSQNDTILLVSENISKSQRGTSGKQKKIKENPFIWWLYKNRLDKEKEEREIKDLIGILAKEAGDQSKIQVVENLSRYSPEYKSYVSTVDSFFSFSCINGAVIFRGGNVEIFMPEGFEVLDKNEKARIIGILNKINDYNFYRISDNINLFFGKVSQILSDIIGNNDKLKLPDTTILIFTALIKQFESPYTYLTEEKFNLLYNSGNYDPARNSGITDNVSFLNRLINFDKILELFQLLDIELNEVDKYKISSIIESYLINNFKSEELLLLTPLDETETPSVNNIKEQIYNFLEQFPLLFLLRNKELIFNGTSFVKSNIRTIGRSERKELELIREWMKQILKKKYDDFLKKFGIPDILQIEEKYTIIPMETTETTEEIETVFDDNDFDEKKFEEIVESQPFDDIPEEDINVKMNRGRNESRNPNIKTNPRDRSRTRERNPPSMGGNKKNKTNKQKNKTKSKTKKQRKTINKDKRNKKTRKNKK
jgi:hypothetical protein